MKCPKCSYLGFETGDRCKNCGYDFSLLAMAADASDDEPDLILRADPQFEREGDRFFDAPLTTSEAEDSTSVDNAPDAPPPAPLWQIQDDSALPLFKRPGEEEDDEPLIKLPVAPRPPLAVRRAAEAPRLRAVPRSVRPRQADPELEFAEEPAPRSIVTTIPAAPSFRPSAFPASGAGRRLGAVFIDHVMLLGIDAAVVYFTLRMSGLYMNDWRLLPLAPVVAFLGLIKFGYFWAFTAAGGQTIGKMAMRIYVVADESDHRIDGTRALGRTAAGLLSFLTLGVGFLPALFGRDRRALHDRISCTRVVRPRAT